VFKSGKRKGQLCNKECSGSFCSKHSGISSSTLSYSLSNTNLSKTSVQIDPINIFNNNQIETLDMLASKLVPLETSPNNKNIITKRFLYIQTLSNTSSEYQKNLNWMRYALNFPYSQIIKMPVSIQDKIDDISCYVSSVYSSLNDYIYGMKSVKEEILAFICRQISNPNSINQNIALCGNNGVGKTRLAHGLAKALNLPIKVINLGIVPDVYYFTGHGFTYVDSEPGRIVQILIEAQCKNCIIYFDELDKIHQTEKGQAIFSFLTHLIDPSQNNKYQDIYLSGLELDVSQVLFMFSFNNENLIDKTVKDRLKIINIPDPTVDDKIAIIKKFIIPELCSNINYKMNFEKEFIEKIASRNNLSLRQIKILFEDIISKMNMLRMLDDESKVEMSFFNKNLDKMINKIATCNEKLESMHMHMYS
jgi:ATP-dependent Lon protease